MRFVASRDGGLVSFVGRFVSFRFFLAFMCVFVFRVGRGCVKNRVFGVVFCYSIVG